MNTAQDDRLLEQFFGGRLQEGARDAFLARCLADPELLERLRAFARDSQLAEKFLRDELPPEQQQVFEAVCIADPELFTDLQVLERSIEALENLQRSGKLAENASTRYSWRTVLASPQYALAASVLLVAALLFSGFLYRENLSLRNRDTFAGPTTTQLVPLLTVRGQNINTMLEPDSNEWTVLLVDPGLTGLAGYRASVMRTRDGASEQIWQVENLTPTNEEQLAIGLPGAMLSPGEYEIIVEGQMGDDPESFERISAIPLRVVARQDRD